MYSSNGSAWREGQSSVLESYIERACSPMLSQPNLSLNLEIADLVNQKKANTPREAAMSALQHINRRNTHVSMLGLHLLDILVKNCGYPFHLQVATKDFLNELVRRFPEKPPVFPPPPMQKILEMIHEWKLTICSTSKHKEDLVHIRDMHRLLSYKGYRFPDIDRRAAQVLNDSDRLKSADELEEEDREAQAAKLQELIRRGTPKDLAAAQELMKIMSGAEPENKPDYAAQQQKDLDRVQSRVLLLNELLNNAKPGEKFVDGDAFDQISQKCKQVQPKLQKWIGEAAENQPEMMDRLLLINDLINNVLNRYTAFKKGDFGATAEIDPAFAGRDTAAAKTRAKEVSLIDFDDPVEPAAPPASSNGNASTSIMDDFGSLSLGPTASSSSTSGAATSPPSQSGPGGLPMGLFDMSPAPTHSPATNTTPMSLAPGYSSTANFFSTQPNNQMQMNQGWASSLGGASSPGATPMGSGMRAGTPVGGAGVIKLGGGGIGSASPSPKPTSQPQPQLPKPQAAADPFADLASW